MNKKYLSAGIALSLILSANAMAATTIPCSPEAAQAIARASSEQLKLAHANQDAINKSLLDEIKDANGASATSLMSQCVGSFWPGGSFRMPTLNDLIEKGKAYVQQQCSNLRSKVSESLPSMQDTQFNIPGIGNVGMSGGVNQGGSNPVWTVNGQNPSTGLGGITNTPNFPTMTQPIVQPQAPTSQPAPTQNPTPIDRLKCVFGGC